MTGRKAVIAVLESGADDMKAVNIIPSACAGPRSPDEWLDGLCHDGRERAGQHEADGDSSEPAIIARVSDADEDNSADEIEIMEFPEDRQKNCDFPFGGKLITANPTENARLKWQDQRGGNK